MNLKDIYFKNKETKDLGIVELLRKNAKAKFHTDFVWLSKYTLAPKDLANWFFCNSGLIGCEKNWVACKVEKGLLKGEKQ